MPKTKQKRNANRPSVKANVLALLKLGYTKEDIASQVGKYTSYAVRSWAVNDVRPNLLVAEKLEQMLKKARKKKGK